MAGSGPYNKAGYDNLASKTKVILYSYKMHFQSYNLSSKMKGLFIKCAWHTRTDFTLELIVIIYATVIVD